MSTNDLPDSDPTLRTPDEYFARLLSEMAARVQVGIFHQHQFRPDHWGVSFCFLGEDRQQRVEGDSFPEMLERLLAKANVKVCPRCLAAQELGCYRDGVVYCIACMQREKALQRQVQRIQNASRAVRMDRHGLRELRQMGEKLDEKLKKPPG